MRAAPVVFLLFACSAPPRAATERRAAPAPTVTPAVPDRSCAKACEHAIDLQLKDVDEARWESGPALHAGRSGYIEWCSARCGFDAACVQRETSVVGMIQCEPLGTPTVFMPVLADVFPLAPYLAAPRKRMNIFVLSWGSPAPTIAVPEGMTTRLEDGWNVEAPAAAWMSPLEFNVRPQYRDVTLAVLRGMYAWSDRDREVTAIESKHDVRLTMADGIHVVTLVFVRVKTGYGLLCRGDAKRISGFDDEAAVVRFLEDVCASIDFPGRQR